jgi:hypothetical protein
MPVRRLVILALFSLVASACRETTAGPTPTPGQFLLESIGGLPLPHTVDRGGGDRLTIFWATLTLEPDGDAITATHWRVTYPGYTEEQTSTSRQEYRIRGDTIIIGSFRPCPINAICMANREGLLNDSILLLAEAELPGPTSTLYFYRRAPGF